MSFSAVWLQGTARLQITALYNMRYNMVILTGLQVMKVQEKKHSSSDTLKKKICVSLVMLYLKKGDSSLLICGKYKQNKEPKQPQFNFRFWELSNSFLLSTLNAKSINASSTNEMTSFCTPKYCNNCGPKRWLFCDIPSVRRAWDSLSHDDRIEYKDMEYSTINWHFSALLCLGQNATVSKADCQFNFSCNR